VAEPGSDVPSPHRKTRSRRLVAFVIVTVICAAAVGVAWYWWSQRPGDGIVGQCFPAAADGPLDTAHGTVSCSDPNASWQRRGSTRVRWMSAQARIASAPRRESRRSR
jgi:hypothetical protein